MAGKVKIWISMFYLFKTLAAKNNKELSYRSSLRVIFVVGCAETQHMLDPFFGTSLNCNGEKDRTCHIWHSFSRIGIQSLVFQCLFFLGVDDYIRLIYIYTHNNNTTNNYNNNNNNDNDNDNNDNNDNNNSNNYNNNHNIYIYIYKWRSMERDRERERYVYVYIYTYS